MAVGALPVIQESGRRVPEDVAVVGYDNSGLAMTTKPALTTVVQPVIAMARAAGEELVGQLHGEPARTEPQIFHPELIVRGSA
jgi:DNA-binding LacI/PurR family transcriptional regulator